MNITNEDKEVPANIVEGDSDMLETEIIQGYHGDKDNRERQNLQKKDISILGCDKCYRKRSRVFVCVLNGFVWKGEQRNAAASRA